MEAPRHRDLDIDRCAQGPPHDETPPGTIPIQPNPAKVRVVPFRLFQWWVTAIMRHWTPGDSGAAGRCRLCPTCKAHDDGCLMIVARKVSVAEAGLFSVMPNGKKSRITPS